MTTDATTLPATTGAPVPTTPTVATPVAPVPEVKPEPKQEPAAEAEVLDLVAEDDEKDKPKGYATTEDPKLDMALAFFFKHGFEPGNAAIMAAAKGDFSLIKAQLAEKQVAGSDAYVALAEDAYSRHSKASEERRSKDKAAIYAAVGGEEKWQEVQAWATENAPADQKAAIAGMLMKGGAEAVIAATYLNGLYGGGAETDGAGPAAAVHPGSPATGQGDALSPQAYGRAVAEARVKHGPSGFEQSPEYLQLRERRLRFKG